MLARCARAVVAPVSGVRVVGVAARALSTNAGPTLLELVKQLRKETSAGIADCKDALVEANHDVAKAKLILQGKAKKTAAKKAARQAMEGVVLAHVDGQPPNKALLLELNCETDFAAKVRLTPR